jgi:hypothetical protein
MHFWLSRGKVFAYHPNTHHGLQRGFNARCVAWHDLFRHMTPTMTQKMWGVHELRGLVRQRVRGLEGWLAALYALEGAN